MDRSNVLLFPPAVTRLDSRTFFCFVSEFFIDKIRTIRNCFPQTVAPAQVDFPFSLTDLLKLSNLLPSSLSVKLVRSLFQNTCEFDPIPATLLCENLDVLLLRPFVVDRAYSTDKFVLPTITDIMNHSLATGTVPSDFKITIVKPLLRKPSLAQNALSIYRPIFNLPFLSKILENRFTPTPCPYRYTQPSQCSPTSLPWILLTTFYSH